MVKTAKKEKTAKLKIHTENILPIIKQWLYSDKDIFIRELVSNACDAIHKFEHISDGKKESENKIEILIDKENQTIQFTDTGIGMTDEEIEKYIAQIAFSGAEEFMKKYESKKQEDQIIGHFGLGFYSSYMVSKLVTIDSKSHKKGAKAAFWQCDGSSEYQMKDGVRKQRGTAITLHIDEENKEYLEETRIREILVRYCSFLPYPLFLNGEKINKNEPLWLKNPKEISEEEYLQFYRLLYPMKPDPILWIHLNVDFPFHLKGILYFPKLSNEIDYHKNSIQLYCNRVFVSDNCKDLIPDYLMVLQGAIDSPDIPLNVSRSALQMDATVRSVGTHISKKVADKLKEILSNDRDRFLQSYKDFELILKMGAMQDDKFYQRIEPCILWKTTKNEFVSIKEYIEKNLAKTDNKVFYAIKDTAAHFIKLYEENDIDVLQAHPFIDTHFISYLESKLQKDTPNLRFQRIDAAAEDSVVDASKESTVLDSDGKTQSKKLSEMIKGYFNDENILVEAKSLQSDSVFGFVAIDEQTRRMRDIMEATSREKVPEQLTARKTFIVNTNHSLVKKIPEIHKKNAQLCEKIVHEMFQLCLISQKEMNADSFSSFLSSTSSLIEELALQL